MLYRLTRPWVATVYGPRMEVAELAYLRRARDLLDREYARPLDVPEMARTALMSPSLFSRRFREAYGDTPYGYLQARRVERAMALLRSGHRGNRTPGKPQPADVTTRTLRVQPG